MGNLDSRGDLAIAEIVFYSPAFLISVGICFKQGFARNLGWFYLVLISIFRLIGSSCTLYMETQNDYSSGLIETAAITSSIGTAPLLLALLGFLERINGNMDLKGLSNRVFTPIHLVAIVALILGIVGGVYRSESDSGSISTGAACMKAASILYLLVLLALAVLAGLTTSRISHVPHTETKMLYASIFVVPFLLVRVIYTVASSFGGPGSIFYFKTPNVFVEAFMMFLMEAIIVSAYIIAGLTTPKQVAVQCGQGMTDVEMKADSTGRPQGNGYGARMPPARQAAYQDSGRPQRSLGDYRPSRMIRNAISGR
ncbi:hypothetical protein HII31_01326 [Pseudocercospora fuligena]|uniref:DUF7702 domain-containing protein n=1 Tax=Pseudocercospora fuligena TaxID=685502 RepID=A0A8H6RUQ8_9PEZI|nr:hypothetical protein HII31_01326 [Pseudocercospora fuligena]